MSQRFLFFFLDLILPLAVGMAVKRSGRVKGAAGLDRLLVINIMFMAPFLTGLSFWKVHLSLGLLWLPVMGALGQLAPAAIAWPRAKRKFTASIDRGAYLMSSLFANRTVVGILSVFILFGEAGYAYARLTMLLGPILFYLVGFPAAAYFREGRAGLAAKKGGLIRVFLGAKQLPLLGLALGASLNLAGVRRPDFLGAVFPYMVHISAWLFVLPIGFSFDLKGMRPYWRQTADLAAIKLLVTPLLVWPAASLAGLTGPPFYTAVLLAASPAAIGAVVICKLERLNANLAMAAYFLSTAVYLVAVLPIILFFAERL